MSVGAKVECRMPSLSDPVPVVLFAYARPDLLSRTLEALCINEVPLLYVYCDGPADRRVVEEVETARHLVRGIDWCESVVRERSVNLGLGRSILAGVEEVLKVHDKLIVVEDDVVLARGAYRYLCESLTRYEKSDSVFSVSAHLYGGQVAREAADRPFFGGRFACWGWATWRRAWRGMDRSAMDLLRACRWRRRDVYRYGSDIPELAFQAAATNTWAVRFALVHILHGGLCLYPPRNFSQHIGYDARASNAKKELVPSPSLTDAFLPSHDDWPAVAEHPDEPRCWQGMRGKRPSLWKRMSIATQRLGVRLSYRYRVIRSCLPK